MPSPVRPGHGITDEAGHRLGQPAELVAIEHAGICRTAQTTHDSAVRHVCSTHALSFVGGHVGDKGLPSRGRQL